MTARTDISDPDVRAAFEAFPDAFHQPLRDLRQLILETAEEDPRIGTLRETLKWGQPSWLPARPRVGTTIRLGADRPGAHLALFFHCQTSVIRDFRNGPGRDMRFDGNRAILLDPDSPLPRDLLRLPIRHALTYHLKPVKTPKVDQSEHQTASS
ncbi:MAG: DUF1801 domain-containing protein [Minwuia sp.]|nr:DUF1801 domain-containing protein [Minwuia sp.]